MEQKTTYDVVILGAGVAGCATAIALKNQQPSLAILLIDRDEIAAGTHRIGETLPPHASKQLQHLGLWNAFLQCRFQASYGTSAAWGEDQLYVNEFIYSPYGYGWNLDRAAFDRFMQQQAIWRGIHLQVKASCVEAQQHNQNWLLTVTSEKTTTLVNTSFVVDATGKKAAFASMQAAVKINKDKLVGIYRHYSFSSNATKIARGTQIEATPYGWWYSATLPQNQLVVGCMTDADIASRMQLKEAAVFDQLLNQTQHTSQRILTDLQSAITKTVAAQTQLLEQTHGQNWLAVGDAASSYDPIASLGIFKSLFMGRLAAYAITDHSNGDTQALQKYSCIIQRDFEAYQIKKAAYYSQEKRFADSVFWQRRQSVATI